MKFGDENGAGIQVGDNSDVVNVGFAEIINNGDINLTVIATLLYLMFSAVYLVTLTLLRLVTQLALSAISHRQSWLILIHLISGRSLNYHISHKKRSGTALKRKLQG